MQNHQLAQLREKLFNLNNQYRVCHNNNKKVSIESQIKQIRGKISNLGANGILKMAVVVIKYQHAYLDRQLGQQVITKNKTESYMFWDLDDDSIYTLLKAYLKNGEEHISKSIIEIPLKKPIPSSLKDNEISWQIL